MGSNCNVSVGSALMTCESPQLGELFVKPPARLALSNCESVASLAPHFIIKRKMLKRFGNAELHTFMSAVEPLAILSPVLLGSAAH